jgi:hypothetical protein
MSVKKQIDQQVGHAIQIGDDLAVGRLGIGSDLGQFQPIQRTLTGHRHAPVGFPASFLAFQILLANASSDQGIGPQPIVIIQIFVSQAETINPLPDEIEYAMFDLFLIAMIGKTLGIPLEHGKHSIDLRDQRHAAVADNISSFKIGGQNAFAEPLKFDP